MPRNSQGIINFFQPDDDSAFHDNIVRSMFTGGISTSAVFGATVMYVTASDPDLSQDLRYSLDGKIETSGDSIALEGIRAPAFLVEPDTGKLMVNFAPQKEMKGHFKFGVRVVDGAGHVDKADVKIYLVREDQRVKFVFRADPAEIQKGIDHFTNRLARVTEAIVNVDDFRAHENDEGVVDRTKTDGENDDDGIQS